MKISLIEQILAAVQTTSTQAKDGLENVNASNGWVISLVGILTVFIGLVVLVLIINLFGKFFTRKKKTDKDAGASKIADKTVKLNSKQSTANNKTETKNITEEAKLDTVAADEKKPALTDEEILAQENDLQEVLAAVALAIHAELNLYQPDIVTNIDYPSDVSSWAFSSRPLRNSHFDKLYRNH